MFEEGQVSGNEQPMTGIKRLNVLERVILGTTQMIGLSQLFKSLLCIPSRVQGRCRIEQIIRKCQELWLIYMRKISRKGTWDIVSICIALARVTVGEGCMQRLRDGFFGLLNQRL